MPDQLESLLDTLGAGAVEPSPAFLYAVARRRQQRRLVHAASGATLLLVIGVAWFAASNLGSTPIRRAPLVHGPRVRPPAAANVSLVALTRANIGRAGTDLDLPTTAGSGTAEPVRANLGHDAAGMERWLAQ